MNERDLFLSALEIEDPEDRKAHLQGACADDADLLTRVESLLASHEGESRFLQTPVGEQLGDEPTGQTAATLVMGTGSTQDESPSSDSSAASILEFSQLQERVKMADEISLGYLEPSTKPGSLGRLAHYEILEIVGHGAFGTVLRAFDEKLQRVVAIKVMAPELAATSPARKRFVREAQASAQIRHENVVSVYSVDEKPIPYLVMEYIPGETLQHRLEERGPLDVPTVLRLGAQIAEGLAAAHAKDLIHRDIKPGNILLETGIRDRVKITDFGLARAADDASMTQSGVIAGTPMYMAPEQALGHKLDQRADLFSLGSVLYQMVSGRPPFRASSTLAVLKRLTEETPRSIQEIIPETPTWLCDIITKLHAKTPDERFQTAKEVAELLEQHSAHLQNPSQVSRPATVSLAPAKPHTGPEMRSPLSKTQRPLMVPQGIRWPLLIATAIMFVIAALLLAVTESTGLTHLFTGSGVAQGPSPSITPQPDLISDPAGKWVQIFNGTDLDGWMRNPKFPGNWRVEEGILIGAGPSQLGILQSARDYEDFHLRAEVLIDSPEADGGIFFRSLAQSSNELNLCFDPKLPTQQTGSLVVHKPTTKHSVWTSAPAGLAKANEWMTVDIIARGGRAVTMVNGKTAAESHELCGNPRGQIVLQHLGPQTVVRFRKIEIKELKSDSELSTPLPPTFKNTIGMEFVIVPKGKSWLGGGKDKLGDKEVEIPADFYLGKYEVTQEEWEKVMGENPSWLSRTGGGKDAVKDNTEADLKRFPVENVSWDQCQVFVAKLNKLEKETGWAYRLPTEVEWEYASRGGPMADRADSAFDFYLAKPTNTLLPEQANFNKALGRTCKVGSYEANRLGLFDMHGNLWEWCYDVREVPNGAATRAFRGGGWAVDSWSCRTTSDYALSSADRNDAIGLRLARVPSGAPSPAAKTPPLAADVLKDAVLLMNFEKDTFYEKDGKTYVRDLSGNGNYGLCENVEFTADGKAGGGLECTGGSLQIPNSLINRQPNYTIALWGRRKKNENKLKGPNEKLFLTSKAKEKGAVYEIELQHDGRIYTAAYNSAKQPNKWLNYLTKPSVALPEDEWFFLTVTLSGGDTEKAELRVMVNDLVSQGSLQLVVANDDKSDFMCNEMTDFVLDEVAIFQRALTDQEIAAVRALGLNGTAFGPGSLALSPKEAAKREPLPPTFKNSLGMEFVIVPKGKSWLGGGNGKLGDKEVEIPADFYLGKYEVTQEEWEKVIEANPSDFSRSGASKDAVKDIPDADLKRFPVENVSWQDCQFFVERLNKLEKETDWVYRLPKEAEWEYACRGGPMSDKLDSVFSFFSAKPTNSLLPEQANFNSGTEQNRIGLNRPCKVGSYAPNKLGLYDMHGNVWEWCEDTFQGTDRVCRGGSWLHLSESCWAARFYANSPSYRTTSLGLRLARVPSGVPTPEAKTPSDPMPTVEVPPPVPTIHDTWLKAAQLLPLDQLAAALPAKLKEKLPEFDDAFLRAIPRMSGDRQVIMAQAWLKERKPAFAGFDDAWLKAIPSTAADAQVILVTAWLKERNPAFDGVLTHKTEGGVLTSLEVPSPLVHDLTPLRVLTGLRSLICLNPVGYDNRAESDAAVLRSLNKLESINGKSLAQFWKEIEARPAEFKEWLELVSTLNANQKVVAVAAKFKERNPGFGGVVRQKVENGVVMELTFENVRDLSPLRALEGLTVLNCTVGPLSDLSPLKGLPLTALSLRSTQVRDLSPLTGMQLTSLDLYSTQVRDLEPLKGQPLTLLILQFTKVQNLEPLKDMPLTRLHMNGCDQIRDLSPLKGMPLTWLELYGCRQVRDLGPLKDMPLTSLHLGSCPEVRDLEVLKGMPLKKLLINNTGVTDLKPLQALPLEYIRLTPKNITQGLDVLRDMKSLETIGVTDNQNLPAAEFWERYGKGEFQE